MYGPTRENIEVQVIPEPDNEVDKNAIAVQVNYSNEWHRVGYISFRANTLCT